MRRGVVWLMVVVLGGGSWVCYAQDTVGGGGGSGRVGGMEFWRDRLFWTGAIGFWVWQTPSGEPVLYAELSPGVGLRAGNLWYPGVQLQCTYVREGLLSVLFLGPTAFLQFRFLPDLLFLHTEAQYLHVRAWWRGSEAVRRWIPIWLVGGGVLSRVGNTAIALLLLYDVIQHPYSPYAGSNYLVFRMGIYVGGVGY